MRDKGPWARGESAAPQQPDTPERMAAKHLRLMATRYLAGNAGATDVDEAVRSWTGTKQKQVADTWDESGEAECFRRILEAVGDPPCNAKHAAEYACDIFGAWLRGVSRQRESLRRAVLMARRLGREGR